MQVIDRRSLADSYAQAAIDLCFAGDQLERASELLQRNRLGPAETAIRNALDRLAKVMEEMPRVEEYDHVT